MDGMSHNKAYMSDEQGMATAKAARKMTQGMDDTRVGRASPSLNHNPQVDSCLTGQQAVVSKDMAGRSGM